MQDDGKSCGLASCDASVLKRVALSVAQQDAMQGPVRLLSHGSRLFAVPHGWQSRLIGGEEAIPACRSILELEEAMQDENTPVLFIPFDAMMTDADIEKVSRRNGVVKTLFREEKAG